MLISVFSQKMVVVITAKIITLQTIVYTLIPFSSWNNNKTSNNDDINKTQMIMNGMCHNTDIMLITIYLNTIVINILN